MHRANAPLQTALADVIRKSSVAILVSKELFRLNFPNSDTTLGYLIELSLIGIVADGWIFKMINTPIVLSDGSQTGRFIWEKNGVAMDACDTEQRF